MSKVWASWIKARGSISLWQQSYDETALSILYIGKMSQREFVTEPDTKGVGYRSHPKEQVPFYLLPLCQGRAESWHQKQYKCVTGRLPRLFPPLDMLPIFHNNQCCCSSGGSCPTVGWKLRFPCGAILRELFVTISVQMPYYKCQCRACYWWDNWISFLSLTFPLHASLDGTREVLWSAEDVGRGEDPCWCLLRSCQHVPGVKIVDAKQQHENSMLTQLLVVHVPPSEDRLFPFRRYDQEKPEDWGSPHPQNGLTCSSWKGLLWLCAVLKVVHMMQKFPWSAG